MKELKPPEELETTIDQWSILAEQLLLSYEMVENLRPGPLFDLHKMQKDYLEEYFGIKQEPPVLDDKK